MKTYYATFTSKYTQCEGDEFKLYRAGIIKPFKAKNKKDAKDKFERITLGWWGYTRCEHPDNLTRLSFHTTLIGARRKLKKLGLDEIIEKLK